MGFLKPHIDRPGILDPITGDPQGYVTNDGMWAAVPIIGCKAFAIIHNGSVVHESRNYTSAKSYILKEIKSPKRSRLNTTIGNTNHEQRTETPRCLGSIL